MAFVPRPNPSNLKQPIGKEGAGIGGDFARPRDGHDPPQVCNTPLPLRCFEEHRGRAPDRTRNCLRHPHHRDRMPVCNILPQVPNSPELPSPAQGRHQNYSHRSGCHTQIRPQAESISLLGPNYIQFLNPFQDTDQSYSFPLRASAKLPFDRKPTHD
jgi:hypothetical protein